jgi:hypothetical protein
VNSALARDLYRILLISKDLVLYRKLPRFECIQASRTLSPGQRPPWNFCCTMIVSLLACTSYPAEALPRATLIDGAATSPPLRRGAATFVKASPPVREKAWRTAVDAVFWPASEFRGRGAQCI